VAMMTSIRGATTGSHASTRGGLTTVRWTCGRTGSASARGETTSVCLTEAGLGSGIRTVANASINTPGVITHTYDSALSPQIEKWIVVSHPSPDFMLIYWCGNIPIQAYNEGLLLSRHRNDANMPKNVRQELRKTASSFGLNFDDMCSSDNSWCPES